MGKLSYKDFGNFFKFLSIRFPKSIFIEGEAFTIPSLETTLQNINTIFCDGQESLLVYSFVHRELQFLATKFSFAISDPEGEVFGEQSYQPCLEISYECERRKFQYCLSYFFDVDYILATRRMFLAERNRAHSHDQDLVIDPLGEFLSQKVETTTTSTCRSVQGLNKLPISFKTFFPRAVLQQLNKREKNVNYMYIINYMYI